MSTFIHEAGLQDNDSDTITFEILNISNRNQEQIRFSWLVDETWTCSSCTFVNEDSSKTCQLCGSSKEN